MHPLPRHPLIVLCFSLALVFPALGRAADPGPIQMEVYADQPIGTINPMYLGQPISKPIYSAKIGRGSVQTRFPSHGLTNGALIRSFLEGGHEFEFQNGKAIYKPGMTWWDAIQSSPADRSGDPQARFRWMNVDAWDILNYVEQLKDQSIVVTPGFPYQTKETSAAFVAFCNGNPDDTRPIGVDRLGIDWKTVGYWASIRARGDAHHPAHPEPYHVKYWELGNELYFPSGSATTYNGSWLWLSNYANLQEGRNNRTRADYYVHGRTLDGVHHDGYLDYYAAMKAVDPSIQIGAMLAPERYWATPWDYDWNDTLLTDLQSKVDFLSCHPYVNGRDVNSHDAPPEHLERPILDVESQILTTRRHMSAKGYAPDFPLIASEWQSYAPSDVALQQMVSSLFVAESLGVFLRTGVLGECFFGPYDTKRPNGSWSSLVRWANSNATANSSNLHWPQAEDHWNRPAGFRWPDYYAFTLWKDFGQTLLQCSAWVDKVKQVDYFAGLNSSGKYYSVLTVNKTGESRPIQIHFHNASPIDRVEVREVSPRNGQLTDEDVLFNDVDMSLPESEKLNVLEDVPPLLQQPMQGTTFVGKISPYAITLFRFYLAP